MNNKRLLLFTALAVVLLALLGTGGCWAWRQLFPPAEATVPALSTATPANEPVADAPADATAPIIDNAPDRDTTFIQAAGMPPATFNPVYATDATAQTIIDKLYPRLLGQDPNGGFIVPSALAERWEISPDGRTYTFTLRPGIRWSDGEPVSAADFKFTYDALASPLVQSPYRDRTVGIQQIDAPDPTTVVVSLVAPNCAVLHSLRQPLLPSHRFAADFSDLATHALNQEPTISAGPFVFVEHITGDRVILARNDSFWQGPPQIEQWEVRFMADPDARQQALADNLVDLAHFSPDETVGVALDPGSSLTVSYMPTDGYSFLAVNLADPNNPQPGRTEDGTSVPQTPHPILGDLAVRQALAAAIDYERILNEVYNGRADRATSYVPAVVTWAHAGNLAVPGYDRGRAAQLLSEAGWQAAGEGVRMRGGEPLRLSIRTNEDNPQRVQMARLIAEEFAAIGIDVQLEIVPFNQLTATLLDQRFDLVVIGWENLGADPGNSPFWHSEADVPGTGFNFTSFHDAEVDSWLDNATRLQGCDLDGRAALYAQVQQRIAEQLPYVLLAGQQSAWVYQNRWVGISPGPWEIDYNVASWRLP